MNIYPYVYRVVHTSTGEFYIGFRSANKLPASNDLGHEYFTSSKYVKPRFHEFEPQVIAEFFDVQSAYEFEQLLIHENWGKPGLMNRYHQHGKGAFSIAGKTLSEKTKQKMSEAHEGKPRKPHTNEAKRKISEAQKGKPRKPLSEKTKQKMSEARWGKPQSAEHTRKISEAQKGKPTRKTVCRIHDRKEMDSSHYTRWANTQVPL